MRHIAGFLAGCVLVLGAVTTDASSLSFVYLDTQTTVPVQDFSSTSISGSSGVFCNDFDCAETSGSANLATGELKMYGTSTGPSLGSAGQSGFGDRVFIDQAFTGDISVTLAVELSGTYSGDTGTGVQVDLRTLTFGNAWQTTQVMAFDGTPVPGTVSTTFLVNSDYPYFDFTGFLAEWAINGTTDLSHTARFSVFLPDGLTFHSDSGVFLTESVVDAPVPEPASLTLVALGLAGVGARRWRQRSRRGSFHASAGV